MKAQPRFLNQGLILTLIKYPDQALKVYAVWIKSFMISYRSTINI